MKITEFLYKLNFIYEHRHTHTKNLNDVPKTSISAPKGCLAVNSRKKKLYSIPKKKMAQRVWTPRSLKFNPTKIRDHLQLYMRIPFKIELDLKEKGYQNILISASIFKFKSL